MEVVENLNKEALQAKNNEIALQLLEKGLHLLEFSANCGKSIDRNLILTILYNISSIHQEMSNLELAAKHLEGLIFNVEEMLEDEHNEVILIKRMHFLVVCMLQFCGIISQLGQHKYAADVAVKTIQYLDRLFMISKMYQDKQQIHQQKIHKYQKGQYIYEEYDFKYLLLKRSDCIINFILNHLDIGEQELLQINTFKVNAVLSKKQFKEQLQIKSVFEQRSMIGILNENDWVKHFNIGLVMNMKLVSYEEVCLKGEILYEFSQKVLVEKVLLLSVAYFTLATESRMIQDPKSQLYHLKSIYIACNIVQDCENCPYLDHLIESFQRHYKNNLETIIEEHSFADQSTKTSMKRQPSHHVIQKDKDHLKELLQNMGCDRKALSIKNTLNQLQQLKEKLNNSGLKRFKTEPSLHFESSKIKN